MNKETIILWLASIAFIIAFVFALYIGANRAERAECEKWQRWSEQFEGYYPTSWQLAQCQHHGLPLPR